MNAYKIFAIYYMGESYDGDQWTEEECDSKPESDPEVFEIRKDGKEVVSRTDFDETKFICDRLNACDGIPSDQLGEVKKCIEIVRLLKLDNHHMNSDFSPELNALIDSAEE